MQLQSSSALSESAALSLTQVDVSHREPTLPGFEPSASSLRTRNKKAKTRCYSHLAAS